MTDLIPQLARKTLIRAGGPIPPKAAEKAVEKAVEKAAGKAAEKAVKAAVDPKVIAKALEATIDLNGIGKVAGKALETTAKTALTPEIAERTAKLLDTNAAVVLPSDPTRLIGLAKSGTLSSEAGLTLTLGNVSQKVAQEGGFAAVVLSDEGKQALAAAKQAAGLDAALSKLGLVNYTNSGLRFGAETALPISLDLGRSTKHVLVDAKDHTELLKQYGEAVAKGEAPAAIGGTPFTKFFKASDDLYNDLEVEAFQRAVPGFAKRPIDEQKAVASLAGRVAADFPADLPASTRRRVAASMVTYTPVEGAPTGIKAVEELKAFYKGVPAGKGPSIADQIAKDGLRVGDAGRYGKGVYHTPSPTTAGGYTYRNPSTPAEIVSGEVAPGRAIEQMVTNFDQMTDVDTRWIRRLNLDKADFGDYGVTKDPSRFRIKAITRYRPDQATGLENLIPDLLETHRQAPGWTAKLFDRMDPARKQRAFEYALQSGTPEARQSAGFLLARSGDTKGIQVTVDALRAATDAKTSSAAGEALQNALSFLGGDRTQEASTIVQALSGSAYVKGKESTIAQEVEKALGATGTQLLQENGWRKVMGPARQYWAR